MKLLLIDAYSLLFRAFFSSPPLSTKAGEPTGALFGFSRMVTHLLDEHAPDFAVVAFDAHGPTFRHDADETYKAGRNETPDDLKIQQKLVREMMDGLSIPRYEHAGFEADDVIGTLACRGAEDEMEVVVVTGDGDMLQLVGERVKVMLTRRGVSDLDIYDPAAVKDRFGFEPKYIPDYKGLKGDASDNIPGVPGIGDKTACNLLGQFGSLDGIYEHLDEVKPPRIQNLLREHREQAFHSRTMATIVCDLEVDAEPESFRYDPLDPEKRKKAAETARRFEFKTLAARYDAAPGEAPVKPKKTEPAPEIALEETDQAEIARKWLEKHGDDLIAVGRDEDGWRFAHEENALLFSGPIGELKNWIEDENVAKIAHDAKSLMRGLQGENIALRGVRADTLLMSYLIEPQRQNHPIDWMAEKYLKYTLPEPPEPAKKKQASLFEDETPAEEIAQRKTAFAAKIAILCSLEPVLRAELEEIGEAKLFDELELPLVAVLAEIERAGMLLEPQRLRELGEKLESEARRLEAEIWESAGEEFNIGSPKQLQVILYEKLGLTAGRSNKTGLSTAVHHLERLAEDHEIVQKVLDYRGVTKLKSTYVDALLNLMNPETERVHSSLNQTGTVSGRISSTEPNLQNVPIRTPQGREIRKAFVAPPGHVMLSADYSQLELRILAHITGDAPLVEAFQTGEDVHARTAATLFGVESKDVDKEQRRLAKMTNYAIAYGVSGFGLAKQLGTGTAGEAKEFIERYFQALPGVEKYIEDTKELAKKQGYVATLMGRRRPLPEINTPRFQERAAAERTAINHPIQGTAADMMKLAMLAIDQEMRARNLKSRMTMQVHDELVFEVPEDEVETMKELVCRQMREEPARKLGLKVPLVADVGTGCDWESTKGGE